MEKNVNSKNRKLTIANNLKLFRKKYKFSLEEVSEKLKQYSTSVSATTLQRYESGEISRIPVDRIVALSKIYKINPEYLMGFKTENILSKERLINDNIAFFNSDKIDDKEKEELFNTIQEFYFKQKFKIKK
ncbi:DNA-binding helix-turn-helix protein [Leptotrichia hofstadii]|jgi:toxin-antitoxin system, antitoxin component, xre family|uniref:DNA-binding helix-turn-helix protein n=1 Tax=Leptotrichia hofstadii TaxID=157688 RepID=A0A510JFH7_9FUSO|nr:helix-turn-helix transcriptional regulator [Leptotrichia hofstadii]BBM37997.1 DNA-binding helix-turn-helix protein [Leptotrichia hofstadii]